MTAARSVREEATTNMTFLNWLGVIGGALTLLGFMDRSLSLAKWADWLIQNWLLLNKAVWSTVLWFLPPPSIFDANALTLLVFIGNALWGSSLPRGSKTARSWRAWIFVALGGLVIASAIIQQSYVYYLVESKIAHNCELFDQLERLVSPDATSTFSSCIKEEKTFKVGYLARAADGFRFQIERVSPYRECMSNFRKQTLEMYGRYREQHPNDALNVDGETSARLLKEAGLFPFPSCVKNDEHWTYIVSPTGGSALTLIMFFTCAIAIPALIVFRVFGRAISPQRLATRVWLVIVFASSIVGVNFLALHAQEWFKTFGIPLPS